MGFPWLWMSDALITYASMVQLGSDLDTKLVPSPRWAQYPEQNQESENSRQW